MAQSEFDIIATYFNKPDLVPNTNQQQGVPLGIGDDCALLSVPSGKLLALSMDVLVADIHFPAQADAFLIAKRALAVNLSDLAAMGAKPMAFTLGLTLPFVNESWLSAFSEGLTESALKYDCPLIGGDMSRGPLAISIQVHGLVNDGSALKRSGAKLGDKVYVTGSLGAAGLALELFENSLGEVSDEDRTALRQAYYQPEPRLSVGMASAGIASAAIDISDGLLADLGHIADQSQVGIEIEIVKVPASPAVQNIVGQEKAFKYALTAGDDYELALTVPPDQVDAFEEIAESVGVPLSCIGTVVPGSGVNCLNVFGEQVEYGINGYQHFESEEV